MRIFVYNDFILKQFKEKIYGDDSHVLFIKHTVESFFSKSLLGSRLRNSDSKGFYLYTDKKDQILSFPDYNSVSEFLFKPKLLKDAFSKLSKSAGGFDVYWLTWPHPISFLILLKSGRRKKKVLFIRQNLEELIKVRYTGLIKLAGLLATRIMYFYARVFHKDAIIVTVGNEMFLKMKSNFSKVHFISDCIVPKKFSIPPRSRNFQSRKLIFVGRLEPEKGLFVLLNAFEKLVAINPDYQLTIVGEGESYLGLKNKIIEKKLSSKVILEGYVPFGDKLFDLYKSHDIMVISSFSEGLPKIINEARAFSLPIISTEVGGIANELKNDETCLFVPPREVDYLAESIGRLLDSKELYETISSNLHEEFRSNSLEYWSEKFSQIVYNN